MDITSKFTSKSLLEIKFEKDVKGYNPLQVDETLDMVISDYKMYEENVKKLSDEISANLKDIESLKLRIRELEIQLAESKNKLLGLTNNENYNKDNVFLLKRIDALERALYLKGVDPKKI